MAKAVVAALRGAGFATGTVVARNEAAGRPLAEQYGLRLGAEALPLRPSLMVNVTPIGMAGDQAGRAGRSARGDRQPPTPCSTWSRSPPRRR